MVMAGIREAAEELRKKNSDNSLEEKFSNIDSIEKGPVIKESFLRKKIETEIPGEIVGVDGGIIKKRYSAGDLIAVRAVGVKMDFGDKENSVEYIPSRNPEPEFHVFNSEDATNFRKKAETFRLREEYEILESSLESKMILMDGSIVPSYLKDDSVMKTYSKLLNKVKKGSLAGIVEDSYGVKMSEILESKLKIETGRKRDTVLMDSILNQGERSFVRKYSGSPLEHPVLRNVDNQIANSIYTFYLKISDQDLPLRIDYLGFPKDADKISGRLMNAFISKKYTVPAPIVEADRRAKIPEKYIKRFEKRFSPSMKRRDRRTF